MKTENDKIKVTITLDEYTSALMREAKKIALPADFDLTFSKSDNHRMVRLALMAYLRGVIKYGQECNFPMIAELRPETPAELNERANDSMPNQAVSPLTAAELRYCEAEGIAPADFLKAKSSRQ
jgi:hypothetical protein